MISNDLIPFLKTNGNYRMMKRKGKWKDVGGNPFDVPVKVPDQATSVRKLYITEQ